MVDSEELDHPLISAKVIEDSITLCDQRLITLELTAPKFIDAEFCKHRMLSSNSSSSRAIPFKRTLNRDVFIPINIRLNESGMQGYKQVDYIDKTYFTALAEMIYESSVDVCKIMDTEIDLHKQHINRYLEAFQIQRKVATGHIDEWKYFLSLRDAPNADPAIQDLARKIRKAIDNSTSNLLNDEEWHIPYLSEVEKKNLNLKEKLYHSVSRVARVSYDNFDGELSTIEQDEKLYNFLLESRHMTPFEAQAKPLVAYADMSKSIEETFSSLPKGATHITKEGKIYSGNFHGFVQYRQLL